MHVQRRHCLGLLAGGVCSAAGCATASPAHGAPMPIAPGVHAFQGSGGAADEANLGRIGNAGFIVGPGGVIVVDTGTSHAHGRALLGAIAAVTPLPVRVALVTHTRPEFLFGGTAFRERAIPIRMHERTARLMRARCETCLKNLVREVGEAPMLGTEMYSADQTFESTHELGSALIGRPVRVVYPGPSSGPGDIAVFDEHSSTLFGGGLLDHRRIPDVQDGQLDDWHQALGVLRGLNAQRAVAGHGPVDAPAGVVIDGVARYLHDLEALVRGLLAAGRSLLEIGEAAELPAYATWDGYDTIHRRNASVVYLRIERELMLA